MHVHCGGAPLQRQVGYTCSTRTIAALRVCIYVVGNDEMLVAILWVKCGSVIYKYNLFQTGHEDCLRSHHL